MKTGKSAAHSLVLALCFALAACGDGGGGGVASTPAPPSYQTLAQVTQAGGNRTFQSAGTQGTYTARPLPNNGTVYVGTGSSTLAYGQGVTIAYTASTDSYQLTAPNGTTATFTPADVNAAQTSANTAVWAKTLPSGVRQSFTMNFPQLNGVALSYTMIGNWSQFGGNNIGDSYYYVANGGIPTLASDMPRTGSATYTLGVTGTLSDAATTAVYSLNANSTATFSANFAGSSVSTTLNLVGAQVLPAPSVTPAPAVNFGSFNGSGTIAANSPGFTGTFGSAGGFSGVFNGPQAAELGYSWFINSGSIQAIGNVYGKKN